MSLDAFFQSGPDFTNVYDSHGNLVEQSSVDFDGNTNFVDSHGNHLGQMHEDPYSNRTIVTNNHHQAIGFETQTADGKIHLTGSDNTDILSANHRYGMDVTDLFLPNGQHIGAITGNDHNSATLNFDPIDQIGHYQFPHFM
jgi:hypothetical protein